jgi:AraC-like DNA-binding protein
MSGIAPELSKIARSLGGLNCLHIGRAREDGPWRMGAHSHRHHELLLFFSGRHRIQVGGREIFCEAGDALLYSPGCVHAESVAAPGTEWSFLLFEWPRAPRRLPLRLHDAGGRARVLADWLQAEPLSDAPDRQAAHNVMLGALIMQLLDCARTEQDDMVRRTRAFFQERLADPLRLEAVARHVYRSKFHFVRLYRKRTGCTPMEELRAVRLEHARELLLTTGLPLKAIAPRCGLSDEYALSRLFSRQFGISPSAFRARAPNGTGRKGRRSQVQILREDVAQASACVGKPKQTAAR